MARLLGDQNAFWVPGGSGANNGTAVGAGGVSSAVRIARVENLVIWVASSGATTITVQVAHSGDVSAQGIDPDDSAGVWHNLYYGTQIQTVTFTAAGQQAIIIPDVSFEWLRLSNLTAGVNLTAGWSGKPE